MLDDSVTQFILLCLIFILFFHSIAVALRGFHTSTSFFCMVFASFTVTQYIFVFPAAFLGDDRHAWMIGREESTQYLFLVVAALIAQWAGHLLARDWAGSFVARLSVPRFKLSEERLELYAVSFSFVGAIVGMTSAIAGFQGYFIRAEYIEAPPFIRTIIAYLLDVSIVLAFISFLASYTRNGSLKIRHVVLVLTWILAGILSAFKTQVLLPVLFALAAAWMTKRIGIHHFLALVGAILMAYNIVEPMRVIANEYSGQVTADSAFAQVVDDSYNFLSASDQVIDRLINRLDYSGAAVEALIVDRANGLLVYRSRMIEQYELLPMLIFIPGFLWPEKPLQDLGMQLSIDMFNNPFNSITPSAPVVAYLTGGHVFNIFSSMAIGAAVTLSGSIILRFRSQPARYLPIMMLAIAMAIGDTFFSSYIIRIVRLIIIVYLFYYLVRGAGLTDGYSKK